MINEEPALGATFRSLADEVRDVLRRRIFAGELSAGMRLVENELAAELGVSRGPVRDALRMLEASGLVETTPRRGTRVTALRRSDAIELFAIREALEPLAVRLLLEADDPARFAALERSLQRLEEAAAAGDWARTIICDLEFHGAIFEQSGGRRLMKIWQSLHEPMVRVFGKLSHFYTSIEEVPRRHRALLESLRAGDLERALDHSVEHVTEWRDRLLHNIESGVNPQG